MNLTVSDRYEKLTAVFRQILGISVNVKSVKHLSGGCINSAVRIMTDSGPFFMKWNNQEKHEMFLAETEGLKLLKRCGQFTVPEVLGCGIVDEASYLILEFIESAPPNERYWEIMGHKLAALHRHQNDLFGLKHKNYIGSLDQNNTWKSDWIDFFIENRLEVQLQLAQKKGLITSGYISVFRKIYSCFNDLFPPEKPSLLHGDLWSGNVMTASNGEPCLIDPAVYFGHREMEIAFTRLFGGFGQHFYDSYNNAFPMEEGFDQRVDVYNLYPLLVHLNLFGASYLNSIDRIVRQFTN